MSSEPVELRLASWNLWGDARWVERQGSVARMLARLTPDLLAVQELSLTNASVLDQMLLSHRRVVSDLPGDPPVNIWFETGMLDCADSGSALIDDDRGRVAVWARFRIEHTARTVLVVTTHLTWDDYPDPAVGAATRERQVSRLASLIQSRQREGEAVVVLGDMNDQRRAFDALAALGVTDCYERLARPADPTQPVPEYEPFETLPRAVDKILINEGAVPLDVTSPRLPSDVVPPSDHWPVVATVRLHT
jgi:endonuclease/exonuclease/phosphatase family metal-dependent hydrolase